MSFHSIPQRIYRLPIAILLPTLFFSPSLWSPAAETPEAPLVGRKEPFCGAIGSGRFQVTTTATPTKVQAGDPILFSVHIEAVGSWIHAPERPDLKQKAEYSKYRERFHVENAQERLSPDQGKWEFDYSVRPKNERVKEIPSLVIIYFRPGLTPPEKGYMTTSAPAIPLQVTTRAKVNVDEVQGSRKRPQPPDRLYEITTGPQVLLDEMGSLPNGWLLFFLIIAPPIFCISWYLWSRYQNPNEFRRRRVQKSWAARQALRALQEVNGQDPKEKASRVAQLFGDYLRHRFDLIAIQPTPQETAIPFGKSSTELAARIAEVFRACDEIRYAPQPNSNAEELEQRAANLILDLEQRP
jgi:hypothetical protein